MRRSPGLIVIAFLAACGADTDTVSYVCDEPPGEYLEAARRNIENDYEPERSRRILEACPERGYHRRYTFGFPRSALAAGRPVGARVTAAWCNDPSERTAEAELEVSPGLFVFRFNYPWSTETGKYPPTEFRLNRSTLKGGFFADLTWDCRLVLPAGDEG
jgi:hypothetical protein